MEVTANKVTIDSGQTKLEINKDGDLRLVVPTGKKVVVEGTLDNTALSETIGDMQDNIDDIIGLVYPVGAIYMSANNSNPSVLFGGTWESIEDTFLLCAGNEHAGGTTGGEEQHQLTIGEMPIHSHGQYVTANAGQGTATRADFDGDAGNYGAYAQGVNTTSAGQGGAHNNMPPYLTVYVWKRTA